MVVLKSKLLVLLVEGGNPVIHDGQNMVIYLYLECVVDSVLVRVPKCWDDVLPFVATCMTNGASEEGPN